MRRSTDIKAGELVAEAFGRDIAELRELPGLTDIVINNDDRVWAMRSGSWFDTGLLMDESAKLWAINALGHLQNRIVDHESPNLEATIPVVGDRVQAMVPTTSVDGSTIAIRVPSRRVFRLEDFPGISMPSRVVNEDTMELPAGRTERRIAAIRWGIRNRANFLLVGATGSAKTSIANAIINEPEFSRDRLVVIEDRPELHCAEARNKFMWWEGVVNSRLLVQSAMRSIPDRMVFGEFRDGMACNEFLKACNTGHTGNLSTLHANGPREAIQRLLDLLHEVPGMVPQVGPVIDAIGMIVHMGRDEGVRGIVGVYRPVLTETGNFDVVEVA
ncbi:Flp pilus assembly complex ATPase component TadA (plasmid) [Skermanella rosea]|uniref:ATPase, T2SS/T4P/T4SS family n=1 Tax=Skermanella rosea TaxID=1817965 RepID=UPI001933013F|nr:ATPase, T2SS/T4P/T4SS family [Skermanella rosea]UEM08217.1 Flp pilus assembly complex ATPase component TadA [Skermanella rosea]